MVDVWEQMKDEWRAEGRERGLEQGLQQGLQQGLEQGLRQGIALALELKFGAAGLGLMPSVEQMHDVAALQTILNAIRESAALTDLETRFGLHSG